MRTTQRLGAATLAAAALTTSIVGSALAQDVEGTVDVHGSSTVAPVSSAVSEALQALNPGFGYFVGEEGTGDGFKQFFCPNNSDVSDASRQIKDSEAELCTENGVEYVELKIGYDGMAVLTHPDNPIECVNLIDLYAVYGPESNGITKWEDAQTFAQELGSSTEFPPGPISVSAPSTESGTYDSFIELVLEDIAEQRGQPATTRDPVPPFYVGSANDLVIIEGVGQNTGLTTTTGFVGLAYATEAGDKVKILAVDGGDGDCVLPSAETVSDGSYPISRPLFIYPGLHRLESNPAIEAWVDYYLSDEGIAWVSERGYVQLPPDELEETRAAWNAAKGGS